MFGDKGSEDVEDASSYLIVVSMGIAFNARLGSGTSVKIKKSIRDLLHWKDEGFSFFILFCYDAVRV